MRTFEYGIVMLIVAALVVMAASSLIGAVGEAFAQVNAELVATQR